MVAAPIVILDASPNGEVIISAALWFSRSSVHFDFKIAPR